MSTIQKIREKVGNLKVGKPYTTRDFLQFGSRAAVDQALARLVKAGILSRPTRGVYARLKKNPYVGEIPPEPIAIAKAISKEVGAVVQVNGAEAARQMGLSTQVPVKTVFYTSGPSRHFHLGKMEIRLKKVSQRKLALAGSPAGVALTALWYLGKGEVTPASIEKVRSCLSPEEFNKLCSAIKSMPAWMHDAFIGYERLQGKAR
ncbi:MAG: DUF6088 family protein [bacterium]